jgi:hypothetical protein
MIGLTTLSTGCISQWTAEGYLVWSLPQAMLRQKWLRSLPALPECREGRSSLHVLFEPLVRYTAKLPDDPFTATTMRRWALPVRVTTKALGWPLPLPAKAMRENAESKAEVQAACRPDRPGAANLL